MSKRFCKASSMQSYKNSMKGEGVAAVTGMTNNNNIEESEKKDVELYAKEM